MWSVGVIAYELLTGASAFPHGSLKDTVIDALLGKSPLPWETATSEQLRRLMRLKRPILQCLCRDAGKRPSIEQLMASIQSIFQGSATTSVALTQPPAEIT